MRNDTNTKARFAFVAFLLVLAIAGAGWYFFSGSQYATYQIYTRDSVSGLIADAPVEFHGVEVGKVKSVRLVDPHSVGIVLSIEKTAPVTSASVATITSLEDSPRHRGSYRLCFYICSRRRRHQFAAADVAVR